MVEKEIIKYNLEDAWSYQELCEIFIHDDRIVVYFINNGVIGYLTYEKFLECDNDEDIRKSIDYNIKKISNDYKEMSLTQIKNNHGMQNHIPIINNGHFEKELYYPNSNELKRVEMDMNRWKILYEKNDFINDYIKTLGLTSILISGKHQKKLSDYFSKYGNDFSCELITIDDELEVDPNALILDTDSNSSELKLKLLRKKGINKYYNLLDLCDAAEIIYFFNNIYNNKSLNVITYKIPEIEELDIAESDIAIKQDMRYRDYFMNMFNKKEYYELIQEVLGQNFNLEFIRNIMNPPNIIYYHGMYTLGNMNTKYCTCCNGYRYTTGSTINADNNIYMYGPCLIFGQFVDDNHTIASLLQRIINNSSYNYSIKNYGIPSLKFQEQIRRINNMTYKENDIIMLFLLPSEIEYLQSIGNIEYKELIEPFKDKKLGRYFLGNPIHCNADANERITKYLFKDVKQRLGNHKNNKFVERTFKRDVFNNNKLVDEFMKYLLLNRRNTENNGSIIMNANPFTFGHYYLIKYAAEKVDTLYVFIATEENPYFSFEDRYQMAVNSCKDLDNVVILASGSLTGTSKVFPDYWDKRDDENITIDCSLDFQIFTEYIAPFLNIKKRFVGTESVDYVTKQYNELLKEHMPLYGIEVFEVPRFTIDNEEISAKKVRKAMETNMEYVKSHVPAGTFEVLTKYEKKLTLEKK